MAGKKNRSSSPRKPPHTFVYGEKRRNRAKEIDAMIGDMTEQAHHMDLAIARAKRSMEELREALSKA